MLKMFTLPRFVPRQDIVNEKPYLYYNGCDTVRNGRKLLASPRLCMGRTHT